MIDRFLVDNKLDEKIEEDWRESALKKGDFDRK